ncbi:hypothetical protein CEP54_014939 [Fusarium duplospermum]|uniref:Uncharacterized protein n=1 Tax=Fusarium duplospermum TaxID=1325734 RepID=A0A428NSJ9_9HYPO|nr:hypothetical protein CEP54_014939 [Fusarium duplospermum]
MKSNIDWKKYIPSAIFGSWIRLRVTSLRLKFNDLSRRFSKWRHRVPTKRPPLLLTTGGMVLQLFFQLLMIAVIGALWHISQRDNGLATVPDNDNASFDLKGFHPASIWSSSIVWATVPAWIISAYSSLWSAMLEALKKVQPTLELDRPNATRRSSAVVWEAWKQRLLSIFGRKPSSSPATTPTRSTAKRTLLLDYGEWPVLNGFKAIKQGHVLLGIGMLLRVALWTASGLSAAIFAIAQVPLATETSLYSDKFFDEWLGWDNGKGTSFSSSIPALEMVSATVVRGAQNYSWTTDTHSFLPYFPTEKNATGNYTFDTEAYWATVECNTQTEEDLVRADIIKLKVDDEEDEYNSAQVQLRFNSDGCRIFKWFNLFNTTLKYAKSWSVVDCGLEAGRMRLGLFTGTYNASERFLLTNLTLITCKPKLYRSNATLEVSLSHNPSTAKVLNFTQHGQEQFWPGFAKGWIQEIYMYSVFDPKFVREMDSFGRLVIGHASNDPSLETIADKEKLLSSFKIVFQAFFANYVSLQAYYPAKNATITGTVSRLQFRLFVVKSPAFAVVGIFATVFCVTLILLVHLHENRASIEKFLDLMLGNALMFRRSQGVEPFLQTLENRATLQTQQYPETVSLVKFAEKQKDMEKWPTWMDGTTGDVYVEAPSTPVPRPPAPSASGSGSSRVPLSPTAAPTAQNTSIPMHSLPHQNQGGSQTQGHP